MLGKVYIVLAIVPVGEGDGTVGNDEAGGGKTHPNPSLYGGAYVIGGSRDTACRVRNIILCVRNNIFRPAGAFIYHSAVGFVRGLGGHNVGTGAKAGVGEAHFRKAVQVFLVDVPALALPYGFAIPGEAQPLQVVHKLEGILPAAALRIEVLNAQNPLAPLALG